MEHTQARSNMYALISRILLQEVDGDFISILKNDPVMLDFFPNLKAWNLFDTLSTADLINQQLNVDFTNISLLHLIPYETFYTRDDQMIETGGANPVTNMYHQYNFLVDYEKARTVSADHIGIEIEFMHHMVEAELKATKEEDFDAISEIHNAQYEFLNKHLLQWAPHYLIAAKYESRTPFYHDGCEMALEFLLSDNEYLTARIADTCLP